MYICIYLYKYTQKERHVCYTILCQSMTFHNKNKSTISCHTISCCYKSKECARHRRHTPGSDSGPQAECAHTHGTAGTPPALTYFSAVPLRLLIQITNSKTGSDLPRAVVYIYIYICIYIYIYINIYIYIYINI